ncbi:MAG TPA: hypothetical protein VE994_11140, partial [Terriglobales bacterium]|nr:hypothetical protein [Terriglobales bacterium]
VDEAGRDVEYVYDDQDRPLQVNEYGSKPILTIRYSGDLVERLTLSSGRRYEVEYTSDRKEDAAGVVVSEGNRQIAVVQLQTRSHSRGFRILPGLSPVEQSSMSQRH